MGGCFSRKETRLMEKRKQEEYTNKLERDLTQAIKELQEKNDNVQTLTLERQNAMTRQEELEEQLADALRERALAETRAAVDEISVLKHEKESLLSSEKIARDEAHNLSERLGRLQRDLTQAIKALQEKHDNVQTLTLERQNATTRQEELEEQLADALRECALAETRAAVAESRYSDMEVKIKPLHDQIEELQQKLDGLLNHCRCSFRSQCKTKKCTCYSGSRFCNTSCHCNMQHCTNTD